MTMRHHSVEFSLMAAGHTKFHPDWHFGLSEIRWRISTVETLTAMADSIAASSRSNHDIPQLVDDPECPVVFYDWASFFKKWLKPIPHITAYHHFRYDMISFLAYLSQELGHLLFFMHGQCEQLELRLYSFKSKYSESVLCSLHNTLISNVVMCSKIGGCKFLYYREHSYM